MEMRGIKMGMEMKMGRILAVSRWKEYDMVWSGLVWSGMTWSGMM